MEEEKKVVTQLDSSFAKSKELVNTVVASMDTMLNQASTSIWCYVALFTLIMIALLIKFG